MVPDQFIYAGVCLAGGLLGFVRPRTALVLYRVTRGRSPDPDARSTTWVRIVSGLVGLVGLVGVLRVGIPPA